jgi:cyanobactin maturation PatA/PatG family protease
MTAILRTADACQPPDASQCRRYLAGRLNVPAAFAHITKEGVKTVVDLVPDQSYQPGTDVDGHARPGTRHPGDQSADAGVPVRAAIVPAEHDALTGVGAGIAASGPQASAAEPPRVETGLRPPASPPPPATSNTAAIAPVGGVGSSDGGESVGPSADCGCQKRKDSGDCSCQGAVTSYIYALGTVGFDFGNEARRDTFRQLMPDVTRPDGPDGAPLRVSPNPYDVFQLYDYLTSRPSESTKLIWTLNLDLTPIYAIEAEVAYPEDVYSTLRDALRAEAFPVDDERYVSRVSLPGVLTNRTAQLFSGQLVPVVVAQPRGMYTWNETLLVRSVIDGVRNVHADLDEGYVSQLVRTFLDKVYFECRNLGQSPPDRALNFAATNAYQFASGIANGLLSGQLVPGAETELYTMDSIDVSKSPYCRIDSDCWDVRITFFDPVNDRRAKSVYQFTIDVSDVLPVTLAPAHRFLTT